MVEQVDDRGLEMSPFNRALVLRAALRADNGCEHCAAQVMAPILKVYPDNWDQITANMGEDYPNPKDVLDTAREMIERGEV